MDLRKQYLIQGLTAAANNLRLTSHQLEVLGLLKECIINSGNVGTDLAKMKNITELSTLGIRLSDLYNYISADKVDYFNISEQFTSHSQNLINVLNHVLEHDNPELIKNAINKIKSDSEVKQEIKSENHNDIKAGEKEKLKTDKRSTQETDELVEEEKGIFSNYESTILEPIRPIDAMLKKLVNNEVNYEDLSKFAEIMKINGEISEKSGFEIISKMHNILCRALLLIKSRNILPDKKVILSMRSCLIVIVAIVKGKDVDITNYLIKAEDFEREISSTKFGN